MPTRPDEVLQTPLQFLKGVGPRKAADFARAGLRTLEDLLYRFPLRYEDRSRLQPIGTLREGQTASMAGEIVQCGLRPTRRPGFRIFEALVRDQSGAVRIAWFNSSYLQDQLHARQRLVLYGTLERNPYTGLQITNPDFELLEGDETDTLHIGRIVPVYERARSITPKMQRRLVHEALLRLPPDLDDPLPPEVRGRLALPGRREALGAVHFPDPTSPLDALNAYRTPAQQRLVFEEFFRFQVGMLLRRRESASECKLHETRVDDRVRDALRAVLPFRLTTGQRQALKDIGDDMQRRPADESAAAGRRRRGKDDRAPSWRRCWRWRTDSRRRSWRRPRSWQISTSRRCSASLPGPASASGLLTGQVGAAERRGLGKAIAAGEMHLVVGTHALVQKSVRFASPRPRRHRRAASLRRPPARRRCARRGCGRTCSS